MGIRDGERDKFVVRRIRSCIEERRADGDCIGIGTQVRVGFQ